MNVRLAAEIPDEGRAFQPPAIPHAVVADVAVLVEGERALVQAALRFEASDHFVAIGLAVWLDQFLQHLLYNLFLIARYLGERNALNAAAGAMKRDLLFLGHFGD